MQVSYLPVTPLSLFMGVAETRLEAARGVPSVCLRMSGARALHSTSCSSARDVLRQAPL